MSENSQIQELLKHIEQDPVEAASIYLLKIDPISTGLLVQKKSDNPQPQPTLLPIPEIMNEQWFDLINALKEVELIGEIGNEGQHDVISSIMAQYSPSSEFAIMKAGIDCYFLQISDESCRGYHAPILCWARSITDIAPLIDSHLDRALASWQWFNQQVPRKITLDHDTLTTTCDEFTVIHKFYGNTRVKYIADIRNPDTAPDAITTITGYSAQSIAFQLYHALVVLTTKQP